MSHRVTHRIVIAWSLLIAAGCSDTDLLDLGPYAAGVYEAKAGDVGIGADVLIDAIVQQDTNTGDAGETPDTAVDAGPDAGDGGGDTATDSVSSADAAALCGACDDGNVCTLDTCDPATGACSHVATSAPCSDGNGCTTKDLCVGTVCTGTALSCDDGNPCTTDGCEPTGANAGCSHGAAAGGCDDGDACTTADACAKGDCVGGPALNCDDGEACTADSCDPLKGCKHSATDAKGCDDSDPCTGGDTCAGGTCAGVSNGTCGCTADADCAKFATGDLCAGKLACDTTTKQCVLKPGSAVVCAAPGACGTEACDKKTGSCVKTTEKDGTACDADGSACTVADACKAGACVAGATTDCDDKNPCTDDACNPKQGCLHSPNNKVCDADGDTCTVVDYCQNGGCVPGSPKLCGDGKACTADSCDSKTGNCIYDSAAKDGAPCDADASICTLKDVCKAGVCLPGSDLKCDDENPCTSDGCNPLTGCTHAKNAQGCSDGNGCTVGDVCTDGGCKAGDLKTCIDGDKCTLDGCDAKTGSCTFVEIVGCSKKCTNAANCDDNNPCTNDICDSGICKNPANAAQCDDGSVCTSGEACSGGACVASGAKSCDDGNPCTDDSCHPKAGCQATANSAPCDADGDKCTPVDLCKDKGCTIGPKKACDDGNACTKDSCDGKTGACAHDAAIFAGDPCDADGSACTVADTCAGGICAKGKALACDDNNVCTTDSCDPKTGCVFSHAAGTCEDGDACTVGDSCAKGVCVTGKTKSCDDGKACTTDACDSKTGGCAATPIPGCGGFCAKDADCDDSNGCTVNSCDVSTGGCKSVPRVGNCKDGDKCWLYGVCSDGSCVGGNKAKCDDGNACTTDTCEGSSGQCVFTGHSKACDDGDPCTEGDVCAFAKCTSGSKKACDDKDVCTIDACAPKTGQCLHTATSDVPCDDGDACTTGETCDKGACKPAQLGKTLVRVGTGKAGYLDGAADKAMFAQPWSARRGPGGVIYVAELGSHRIRAIAQDGTVSTFAGSGKAGLVNGAKAAAQFYAPADAQPGLDGEVYVADLNNNVVRVIDDKGQVSTFAGKGVSGFVDGYKTVARFNLPTSLAVDESGVYVTDLGNHAVRLVTVDGQVVTLAGTGKAGLKDGPAAQAQFSAPYGIARGIDGGLYVADSGNHRVRFITSAGTVLTVAGTTQGFQDGPIQVALLDTPYGIAVGVDGAVYVAEIGNRRVRRVGLDGLVYTVYGDGTKATLDEPFGVAIDGTGGGWVASFTQNQIHRFRLPVTQCDDGNPCTTDACDKKTGVCAFASKQTGASCGAGCFATEVCQSGACVTGQPKNCDDNNNCTGDYCVAGGCKHVPIPKCSP